MKKKLRDFVLPVLWGIAAVLLFLFSYTQVDLGLTLTEANLYQVIEKAFQYIGYFQRPLATGIYLAIVLIFFVLYGATIHLVKKNRISGRSFWWTVGVLAAVLVLSYPAFSYDLFNYMFTAKTVLLYHKSPYEVIPLQFTGVEPWLSFMRWTHLPSAYTPLWIALTLPAYLLGFGYFLLIMWNIKLLVAASYIITVLFIGKILSKIEPQRRLLGMAIFAFNPLVIFETLVSGHNDMVMMALAIAAYHLYTQKRRLASFFTLSLSVALKLMSAMIIPVFFIGWQRKFALWAMIIGFLIIGSQREILGWYVLWLVPLYALLPSLEWATVVGTGLSLGFVLAYAPYFYYGNYDPPVQTIKFWAAASPVILSFCWVGVRKLMLILSRFGK